jgi:2-iminobutanoate/2-iminopropanoate deaminase
MKNEDSQIKDYKTMKKIINTLKAPQPIGPYSQAVLVGDVLYTSGQISLNPETGKLVKDSIDIETVQVMENLKAVLQAANSLQYLFQI